MTQKYQRSADTLFECVDDESVILSLKDGTYYGLNATGKVLWDVLHTPLTVNDLCQIVTANFDGNVSDVEQDVQSFLTGLLEPGLVELVTPAL